MSAPTAGRRGQRRLIASTEESVGTGQDSSMSEQGLEKLEAKDPAHRSEPAPASRLTDRSPSRRERGAVRANYELKATAASTANTLSSPFSPCCSRLLPPRRPPRHGPPPRSSMRYTEYTGRASCWRGGRARQRGTSFTPILPSRAHFQFTLFDADTVPPLREPVIDFKVDWKASQGRLDTGQERGKLAGVMCKKGQAHQTEAAKKRTMRRDKRSIRRGAPREKKVSDKKVIDETRWELLKLWCGNAAVQQWDEAWERTAKWELGGAAA